MPFGYTAYYEVSMLW